MADCTYPLYWDYIGNKKRDGIRCCYPNDQNAPACHDNIRSGAQKFSNAMFSDHAAIDRCQHPGSIFSSKLEDGEFDASGVLPKLRFPLCANAPNLAKFLDEGILAPDILKEAGQYIIPNASDRSLKNINLAITDCLTATCRNARNSTRCHNDCAGTSLLRNPYTPDLDGINQCLDLLCSGDDFVYDSLPYADSDVIGIGVLSSCIMQCGFMVLLFVGLLWVECYKRGKSGPSTTSNKPAPAMEQHRPIQSATPNAIGRETGASYQSIVRGYVHGRPCDKEIFQGRFVDLIEQFHKAQCYFSVTIQVTSLRYGIFDAYLLKTFLLVPLVTNGVLPVIFAYVLLLHCHKCTLGIKMMTTTSWLLSSLVYWTLYSHLIPINADTNDEAAKIRVYNQFTFKLSALDARGGYSALAVCPQNPLLGKNIITHASHKIRILTLIIWAFSTFCLLITMVEKLLRLYGPLQSYDYSHPYLHQLDEVSQFEENQSVPTMLPKEEDKYQRSMFENPYVYGASVLCFLAGTGMQLSLFSVALSLRMTDRNYWSFGQLVALTIWFPPFIAWIWKEMQVLGARYIRRKGMSYFYTLIRRWAHDTHYKRS